MAAHDDAQAGPVFISSRRNCCRTARSPRPHVKDLILAHVFDGIAARGARAA